MDNLIGISWFLVDCNLVWRPNYESCDTCDTKGNSFVVLKKVLPSKRMAILWFLGGFALFDYLANKMITQAYREMNKSRDTYCARCCNRPDDPFGPYRNEKRTKFYMKNFKLVMNKENPLYQYYDIAWRERFMGEQGDIPEEYAYIRNVQKYWTSSSVDFEYEGCYNCMEKDLEKYFDKYLGMEKWSQPLGIKTYYQDVFVKCQ